MGHKEISTSRWHKSPRNYTSEIYRKKLWAWKTEGKVKGKSIAIVGAGMAGLVAGWLLKRAGYNKVRIYEASNVVGGRIRTLRGGFTGRLYAEAGAMRIPSHHVLTNELVEFFNLLTSDFTNESIKPDGIIYVNGNSIRMSEYRASPERLKFGLKKEEDRKRTAEAIFKRALQKFEKKWAKQHGHTQNKKDRNATIEEMLRDKSVDALSLKDFLKNEANLSAEAIDYIGVMLNYETSMAYSLTEIYKDFQEFSATEFKQIKGGMDLLPRAFVQQGSNDEYREFNDDTWPKLAAKVRYNARVTRIVKRRTKFELHYENPVTRVGNIKKFDRVILALPFSALQHIRLINCVSDSKHRAIRQLHYDNSCKVILEFSKKFWENQMGFTEMLGGESITDLPLRTIYYPNPYQFGLDKHRMVILASYTWSDDSLRWTALSRDDRLRFALRGLADVHRIDQGKLEQEFIGGMSHSWAEDEFTHGAFAMFQPYQQTELFNDIWRPDGGLHFAGEHTSLKHAWIEGAVESGIRVAIEVDGAIKAET